MTASVAAMALSSRYMVTPSQLTMVGAAKSNRVRRSASPSESRVKSTGTNVTPSGPAATRRFHSCVAGWSISKTRTWPGERGTAGEGIQARAEHDVLADAAPDAAGQAVLGVTAPAGYLRPGAGQDRVGAVRPVVADELVGPLAEHGLRQGIGENQGIVVDDQMGGARGRRGKRGQAGLSVGYHADQITINFSQ